jgi:hypothetical protein
VDTEDVTQKYTGHRIGWTDLLAAHPYPLGAALARALERAADAVNDINSDLSQVTDGIDTTLAKVRRTLATPAGPVPTLNPLGEFQSRGPRLDALIAARHDRITHLRAVCALWRTFTALQAPQALGPALEEAGFTPMVPPRPSPSAYGRWDRDRHITVILAPDGQGGAMVTVDQPGGVAWTVTTGHDVPDSVVAAIAYAALASHPGGPASTTAPDSTSAPGTAADA